MVPSALIKLPKILGGDVSGVVVEAPDGSKVCGGEGRGAFVWGRQTAPSSLPHAPLPPT